MEVLKEMPPINLKNTRTSGLIQMFFVCFILLVSAQSSRAQPSKEYQVKAVFLFNFTQFAEWPGTSLTKTTPLIIGVLGKNPFGSYLNETVKGEKVNGHPIIVKQYLNAEEIEDCHILFLNLKKTAEIKSAIARLKNQSTLTVSDVANFTKLGGAIQFITVNNKIKLQINVTNVADANITISSKLLHLAEIVN